jgi:transcriptional regulator NrdR family protein
MARVALTHVCKRDGRLVPFDRQRLVRAIQAAAEASPGTSTTFAQELADAVILHLEKSFPASPPSTAAIAEAVETVLLGVNLREAAEAYRAYREARAQSRMRCTVVKPLQPSLFTADIALHVSFDGMQRTAAWDRTRIIHALEREARIARGVAEDIARVVEERLLSSDVRRVTTTLIRALVDNELLARGFTASLRQRSAVAVPFADIDRALQPGAAPLATAVGRTVTRAYTLARVYSDDVTDAHERGMLALDCLDHPAGIYCAAQAWPAAAPRAHVQPLLQQLQEGLAGTVAWSIDDCAAALPLVREMLAWLPPLRDDQCITLGIAAHDAAVLPALLDDIAPRPHVRVQIQGVPADRAALLRALPAVHARGWHVAWSAQPLLHVWHCRCTLNLPQAVYRARQRDLDGVIEELYRALELAVQACQQRINYFRAHHPEVVGDAPFVALDVAGLDTAIAILTGAGIFDQGQGKACLRVLLGALQTSVHHATRNTGMCTRLVAGEALVCGKRLAAVDQSLFPELFGFLALHSDALEPVIPAYLPVELGVEADEPPARVVERHRVLQRFFDDGCLPIRLATDADDECAPMCSALLDAGCCFALPAGATQPTTDTATTASPAADTPRLL